MKPLTIGMMFFLFSQFICAQIDTLLICDPSDVVQLHAPENRPGYKWTPSSSLDNPTIHNPIAFPVWNTLYIAEMIGELISGNLIENADFEQGNLAFESEYPYSDRIFTQGLYGVSTSAKDLNGIYFTDCPDHTSGDGLMMVVDGSPLEGEKVWCQTINIKPNTKYAFSTWLASVMENNPAELQFFINNEPLGFQFTAVEAVCQWRQFYHLWQSGDTSLAEICIINKNTDPNGNDFALDDFLFAETEDLTYDSTFVIINDVQIGAIVSQLPDCGVANGEIEINPKGIVGSTSYSINGDHFQDIPFFENVRAGEYTISIKQETNSLSEFNSCISDTIILVGQDQCPIYVPNAINRRSLRNQLFRITPHPDFVGTLSSLSIFDRWGNHVYYSDDHDSILTGWNGKSNDQFPLLSGVYGYVLNVGYPDGRYQRLVGNVTLF